jgi:hypothetical protein
VATRGQDREQQRCHGDHRHGSPHDEPSRYLFCHFANNRTANIGIFGQSHQEKGRFLDFGANNLLSGAFCGGVSFFYPQLGNIMD